MAVDHKSKKQTRFTGKSILALIAALALAGAIYAFLPNRGPAVSVGTTFVAARGPLTISVLQGGSVEAIESQEIRSEIKGRDGAQILDIVEEGYLVTREDVQNGKVLVRLDSAQIENQLIEQEIQTESTRARFIEQQAAFDIQLNQNKSNIKAAALASKFAHMDLIKFLGEKSVNELLAKLQLDERAREVERIESDEGLNDVLPLALSQGLGQRRGSNEPQSIELDDELIGEIVQAMAEAGMPADPERFKQMLQFRPGGAGGGPGGGDGSRRWGGGEGRPEGAMNRPSGEGREGRAGGGRPGGGEGRVRVEGGAPEGMRGPGFNPEGRMAQSGEVSGPLMLTPEMAERMAQMGIDVYAIAERLGKLSPEEPEPTLGTQESAMIALEMDSEYEEVRRNIDFTIYADPDQLEDGLAKQELRKLQDDLLVAEENFKLAAADLEATERLVAKDFETQTNLDKQRVTLKASEIKMKSGETAQELYIRYEFPKQLEMLLSDYEESLAKLERTKAEARATLMQAEVRLRSAEKQYHIEMEKLEDLKDQLSKTIIRAERPGLVVYGSSSDQNFRGNQEPIQEGTTVRERQLIITIPDMTKMALNVKIHESAIKQIARGQNARIRIDSFPNRELAGEVTTVAVLPDATDRWMNPDVKVYRTMVRIDGEHEWLRPGMSGQVNIIVDRLEDVLYIPLQSVTSIGNQRVCYVLKNGRVERRDIQTGLYNNEFIEVTSGLQEGDVVLLRRPDLPQENRIEEERDRFDEPEVA